MPAFKLNRLVRACACAGALALSTAAMAEIHMTISARGSGLVADTREFDDSVSQVSGSMFAGTPGAGGSIHAGPLACPDDLCGPSVSWPGANAAATVDMTIGHLGVAARAWANPPEVYDAQGNASVNVLDTLYPTGTLTFKVRVNVDLSAGSGGETFSFYQFGLALGSGDNKQRLFDFQAWDDPDGESPYDVEGRGASFAINRFWEGSQESGTASVDSVFEMSVEVPFMGNSLALEIYNFASAQAEDGASASVSSLNSGYLGIEGSYSSAAGYSYPGYSAPVPEAGTVMLWLMGGGLLALGARRRTARP